MSSEFILVFIALYFIALIVISRITAKGSTNSDFFIAGRSAPWYLVAFGMIGTSLSGITFISIPGGVGSGNFGYMQMVFGFAVGYVFIAYVLMPIYYRLEVVSIYSYLKERFGGWSHKTGAAFFLLSRTLGAGIRLLLVANVLQYLIFDDWNVPFELTVLISIALIWLYTHKGGLKTIIWTDTLQTAFMLISLALTIALISKELNLGGVFSTLHVINESDYSQIFFLGDLNSKGHFIKHFLGGAFIAIGMTGLDQDMMQKNLSCKNLKDAQKNMMSFTVVLVLVNFLFLCLGALIYMFAQRKGIEVPMVNDVARTDLLFSEVALNSDLGVLAALFFLLGLIAAAYSSADSALTSLTTSVSVDFLEIENKNEKDKERIRKRTHIVMSAVLFIVILILNKTLERSAIFKLIFLAGFTYGPLIGLYFFGIFTKKKVKDRLVPVVAISSVLLTALLWYLSFRGDDGFEAEKCIFGSYTFGAELIIVNAFLTFLGLFIISHSKKPAIQLQ